MTFWLLEYSCFEWKYWKVPENDSLLRVRTLYLAAELHCSFCWCEYAHQVQCSTPVWLVKHVDICQCTETWERVGPIASNFFSCGLIVFEYCIWQLASFWSDWDNTMAGYLLILSAACWYPEPPLSKPSATTIKATLIWHETCHATLINMYSPVPQHFLSLHRTFDISSIQMLQQTKTFMAQSTHSL